MADRTSAEIFGTMFEVLAEYVPEGENRDKLSKRFWEMSQGYDFSEYQMECDDALLALGLARRGVNPDYPEDGEVILYGTEDA